MGRKIPGKKHRGTKDPLQQRAAREARVAHIINSPPQFPDDQKVPRSLAHLIALKRLAKEKKWKGRGRRKRERCVSPVRRPAGPSSVHGASKRELHRRQLRELTLKAKEKMRQAQYETKFGVKLVKNREGELRSSKRPLGHDSLMGDLMDKCQKTGMNKPNSFEGLRDTVQKSANGRASKGEENIAFRRGSGRKRGKGNLEVSEEYDMIVRDQFHFREVVHEPPTLIPPKVKTKIRGVNMTEARPGRKGLVLKRFLVATSLGSRTMHGTPVEFDQSLGEQKSVTVNSVQL